jgi:hypothetical protein
MRNPSAPTGNNVSETREPCVPLVAIALGQVLMSFNVSSLPIALSGIVDSFNVAPTTVSTAIVMYSLSVAGLVMLGAKLCQRYGPSISSSNNQLLEVLQHTTATPEQIPQRWTSTRRRACARCGSGC